MTEYRIANGVILGIHVECKHGVFDVPLPTKYLGEGNDIAANILGVLVSRRIAESMGQMDEYNRLVQEDPYIGPSRFTLYAEYGSPPSDGK